MKRKKSRDVVAYFDIHSSEISAALIQHEPKKQAGTLIAYAHISLLANLEQDFASYHSAMISGLHQAATELQKQSLVRPVQAIVTVTTPWCASRTTTLSKKHQEPVQFTDKYAIDAITSDINQFQDRKERKGKVQIELMDYQIMQVRLNGYVTPSPVGKRARQVEVDAFLSVMPHDTYVGIVNAISKTYHVPVEFHPFILSAYKTLQTFHEGEASYMIFDIGDELTEIALVQSGRLVGSASVPYGKDVVMQTTRQTFGKSPAQAASLLKMYQEKTLDESLQARVEKMADEVATSWLAHITSAIKPLAAKYIIPADVFIVTDQDFEEWFLSALTNEELAKELSVIGAIQPISLRSWLLERRQVVHESPSVMLAIHSQSM